MKLPFTSRPSEIPNEEYHRGEQYREFISSTSLKHYGVSPLYARYAQNHPTIKQTPAMLEGTILHDLMEFHVNNTEFPWIAFGGPVNPGTGKPYGDTSGKYLQALEEFKMDNPDKQIGPADYVTNAKNMAEVLLEGNTDKSRSIIRMVKLGKAEQSHFCEFNGGKFKYRTDLKTSRKLADWKKTTLEGPKMEEFSHTIIKYGYHISAAMYQFFEHQITGKWKKFVWVVQENEPPYDFMIHDSSDWSWEISKDEVIPKVGGLAFIKLMDQHIWCLENNKYPGYESFIQPDRKGHRIGVPSVPGWFHKQSDFTFYNDNKDDNTEQKSIQ